MMISKSAKAYFLALVGMFSMSYHSYLYSQDSSTGIAPYTAHGGGADDSINLGNLNLTIPITLYERKERGQTEELHKLVYDAPLLMESDGLYVTGGGWREAFETDYVGFGTCAGCDGEGPAYIEDSLGARHYWISPDTDIPNSPSDSWVLDGPTTDSSGYISWSRPTGPYSQLSLVVAGDAAGNWNGEMDHNGNIETTLLTRTAIGEQYPNSTYAGYGLWVDSNVYTYPTESGTQTYSISSSLHTVGGIQQMWLIDSINLPAGMSYSFLYNSLGQMTSMTTPSGTVYSYQWSGNAQDSNGNIHSTSLSRTVNGGAPTTYTKSFTTSGAVNELSNQATVVDPDGVTSVHTVDQFGYESYVDNGISTTATCVGYAYPNPALSTTPQFCNSPSTDVPDAYYRTKTISVQTTNTEDNTTSNQITTIDAYGDTIDVKYYDYGNTNFSAPDREDINTYDISTVPVELLESQVLDHGTVIKDTTYAYDETPLQTSGVGASSLTQPWQNQRRANPTTISSWVTGNTWIQTHTSYYDTGLPYQVTDGRGNTAAQYTYDATTGCQSSFPTQMVTPAGTTTETWDCNSSQPASQTNIQGVITTNSYADPFSRLVKSSRLADGAITSISYDGAHNRVETRKRILSSSSVTPDATWSDHIDQYDTLGRLTRQMDQHSGSSGPWVTLDTGYTPGGRKIDSPLPQFVSGIDATSTSSTGAQLSYDSYGRLNKSSFNNPSGSGSASKQIQFSGSTRKTTDEAGNSKLMQYNSLGQLVAICELVTDGTGNACGMGIAGSGYKTFYQYDVLGNLKNVNQIGGTTTVTSGGTVADTPRVRQFAYDGLSRLLSAYNPEDQGICYGHGAYPNCQSDGYDGNGNVLYKTSQSGCLGSGACTISYYYDTANRLYEKTASDGSSDYHYVFGSSGSTKGLLTQEYNNYSGQPEAGTSFTYDSVANITGTSWYNYKSGAWQTGMSNVSHDLVGDVTQQTYPDGTTIVSNSWDNGGWNTLTYFGTSWNSGDSYISSNTFDAAGKVLGTNFMFDYSSVGYQFLEDSRMKPCVENVFVPSMENVLLGRGFAYGAGSQALLADAGCGFSTDDNGSINYIGDTSVGGSATMYQSFTYDSLNRLTSATTLGYPASQSYGFIYKYDAFGNMVPVDQLHTPMSYGVDLSTTPTNRLTLNGTVTSGDLRYNANGTVAVAPGGGGDVALTYTAEGLLRCINGCNQGNYLYDSLGERTLAIRNNQNWNEYVYLSGSSMANLDNQGNWTNQIYSAGHNVGRVRASEPVLHLQGTQTTNTGCSATQWTLSGLAAGLSGYNIDGSDSLAFDFKQNVASNGGLTLNFASPDPSGDSSTSAEATYFPLYDQYTYATLNAISTVGTNWQHFVGPLWNFEGAVVSSVSASFDPGMPSGNFDIQIANLAIIHDDGTATQLLTDGTTAQGFAGSSCSATNLTSSVLATPVDPAEGIHYFVPDHLGTTLFELTSNGLPIWQGMYTPFGQEVVNGGEQNTVSSVNPDGTYNRYKFTGKERDVESGLDYFPARYLSSSMGRWISPDPSGLYMADPGNPQQLNLYAYVGNNPLGFTDPLGLSTDCGGGGDPSVVCMVTTAWDWLKSAFSGGGSSGSNNGGDQSQGAGPSSGPDYDLSPGVSPLSFSNVQAAGISAARQALGPTSQADANGYKNEWGGRVLQNKHSGRYTFTNPVTFHSSGHFWTNHVMVPFGYRNAGSYHTHPGYRTSFGMSGQDAQNARDAHLPSFMGEETGGRIWKFDSSDPHANSCSGPDACGAVVFGPSAPPR